MKKENIKDAKRSLITTSPFIGSFLFGISIEIDNTDKNPTACTDGKTIWFNESFIEPLTYQELITLIAHEVCHIAFAHHFRLRGKDANLWNVSTDYAINILLKSMGFTPLKDWLLNNEYKGLSAENIYSLLKDQSKEEQEQKKKQSNKSGGSFKEGKDQNGNDLSNTELDEEKQKSKEKLQQAKANLERSVKAIQENTLINEEDKNELLNTYGKGYDELISEIEFESDSRMDWREVLNRFLSSISSNDFSFNVPDIRFSDNEFLMPSLHSNEVGNVFFALDVSGSCTHDAKRLVTEARECLKQIDGAENSVMKICYCSDRIHCTEIINTESDIKLIYGMGTDFAPAVKEFNDDNDSECLIYITDGFCDSFGEDPLKPVLWVLTRRNDYFNPPYGETVLM